VNILADLYHGSGAAPPIERSDEKSEGQDPEGQHSGQSGSVGTSTVGSSEAVMLGGLAMKWRWRQWRARKAAAAQDKEAEEERQKNLKSEDSEKPTGKSASTLKAEGWATSEVMHGRPYGPGSGEPPCNMIVNAASHVSVLKCCKFLDIQPRVIPLAKGRHILDPDLVAAQLDENTIGVMCILGTTLTGEFDPVEAIHEKLVEYNAAHGTEISIHVDAASAGFTVPFSHPNLKWDFSLPLVKSIDVSGHKFGLVYPGIGWILFRDKEDLPADLVFHVNYLGSDEPSYGLNFTRPAAPVLLQSVISAQHLSIDVSKARV
jgi:glutamate decarboxylase